MKQRKTRMRIHQTISVLLLSLVLHPFSALADTIVGGPITTDATWAASNSPFVVSQSVVIVNGATLTIDPGVEVRFSPDLALVVSDGELFAWGTPSNTIRFTGHAADSDVESNRWGYIRFETAAFDALYDSSGTYTAGCAMVYCIIEYAGGTDTKGAVNTDGAAPFISRCIIRDNHRGGIYAVCDTDFYVLDCAFSNNYANTKAAGLYIQGSNSFVVGNSIIRNTNAGHTDSAVGAYFENGSVQFTSNIVHDNTYSGGAQAGGVYCTGIDGSFTDNEFAGNSYIGLHAHQSTVLVSNNTATANSIGFRLRECTACVQGNMVCSNISDGVNFSSSTATLIDNTIIGNGRGVYSSGGIEMRGNFISANQGGGVYFHDNSANAVVISNTICCNTGTFYAAGLHFEYRCFNPVLIGNVISNNITTEDGGGIYFYSPIGATVERNTIVDNHANKDGGGLHLLGGSQPLIRQNIINRNSSGEHGGGAYFTGVSSLTLDRNTFVSNSCTGDGGAIYFSGCDDAAMQGQDISGNSVGNVGSAIYLSGGSDRVALSTNPACPTVITDNTGQYAVYNANTFSSFSDPLASGNVDAHHVWWGTTNTVEIDAAIYDFFDNAGKGRVFYDPFIDLFDLWLIDHGLGTNAVGDADTDGSSNEDEYYAGTDPTNQYSVFAISNVAPFSATQMLIHWYSVSNRTYAVQTSTNLLFPGWDDLTNGISGTPPLNTVTTDISGVEAMFFRVNVSP